MKSARSLVWLLAFLLVFGQQAGVLHHLGHDLAAAARVIDAADGGAADGHGLPDADDHAGACALCVGFGAAAAAGGDARCEPPVPALAFARPLADAPVLRSVVYTGTPIRGPPPDFSRLA